MDFEKVFDKCREKLELHMRLIPEDNPEFCACENGEYFENKKPLDFMDIQTWMPSFFTGEILLAYERTKEQRYLDWLEKFVDIYNKKVFEYSEQTMHDLGFLYLPYAVGLWQTTGNEKYKKMALKAADELAKRFTIKGGYIRAWGKNGDFHDERASEAIIDCMMNIPLLFWAADETGIPIYREIAERHADTTLRYFVRADGSVYHAYRFDLETGQPMWGCNYCGYADESFWARGCAWAIYGFTVAYAYTETRRYRDVAERLMYRFQQECTAKDGIPVWDFRLPDEVPHTKDTSAAAIVASAAYDLAESTGKGEYKIYAEKLLSTLATERYLNTDANIPGILKESNGLKHHTLFGDYFFMEALIKEMEGSVFDKIWRRKK